MKDFGSITGEPTPRQVSEALHDFMLRYQEEHRKPPTLEEIATALETLNYRSSALAAVQRAMDLGLVASDGDESSSRRYYAIERAEIEARFAPTFIRIHSETLWPDD